MLRMILKRHSWELEVVIMLCITMWVQYRGNCLRPQFRWYDRIESLNTSQTAPVKDNSQRPIDYMRWNPYGLPGYRPHKPNQEQRKWHVMENTCTPG